MNLIEAFEQNLVDGFSERKPDKVIETIVSKIFFYGEDVYKVYKYEKFFFGDFSLDSFRREFYQEDFQWNNVMAPNVYLALRPVKIVDGVFKVVDLPEAQDFYIEMKKFDDDKNLTNLLLTKNISDKDIKNITVKTVNRLGELTKDKRNNLSYNFNQKLIDIHFADLESDRNLLYLIPDFIKKEKADEIFDSLMKASASNQYFLNFDSNDFSLLIDNHADNIVFFNNEVNLIDVLPPKESWRVGSIDFNICRLATDIAVLFDYDKADLVYKAHNKDIPEDVKKIYEARSALIQMWCFNSVKKPDIAKKYLDFAEGRISLL